MINYSFFTFITITIDINASFLEELSYHLNLPYFIRVLSDKSQRRRTGSFHSHTVKMQWGQSKHAASLIWRWRNFVPISLSYRVSHFGLFWGYFWGI